MWLQILILPVLLVIRFFNRHDYGPKEPIKSLLRTILFGILAIVLALGLSYALESLLNMGNLFSLAGQPGLMLMISVLAFAAIEEAAKFLPMAFWIRKKPFFEEVTDGVIYFAYVGFVFGIIENLIYALSYGTSMVFSRTVIMLYFHGALSSIVGYFFAKGIIYKKSWRDGLLALITASLIHAVYNYFVFSSWNSNASIVIALIISALLNSVMFWLFYRAQVTDYNNSYPYKQNAVPAMQPTAIADTTLNTNPTVTINNNTQIIDPTPSVQPDAVDNSRQNTTQ